MEITITTTTKKLSKSLISQMPFATDKALKHGKVLGFMLNVRKQQYSTILIEFEGEYYIIPDNWKYSGEGVSAYRNPYATRGSIARKFDTEEAAKEFWADYQKVIENSSTHIYI